MTIPIGVLILMKYTAAILIALFSVVILSCGAGNPDSEPEQAAPEPSSLDIFLAEQGFDSANAVNEDGDIPLQLAAFNGKTDIVRLLISEGVETDVRGANGSTPLSCATIMGHLDIVQLLVEDGADVNFRAENENHSETPLHQAAGEGYTAIAEYLLDAGAEVSAAGTGGLTPLHLASGRGHNEVVELLLARGALVDAVTEDPQITSFEMALNTQNYETAALLAEAGADDQAIYLLENEKAGLFELGMSLEVIREIARVYGDHELVNVDLMLEGMSTPAIEIVFPQDASEALVLEFYEDVVYRIKVLSDDFMTENGFCTASSFGDLQDIYEYEGAIWGETGNPLILIEELDASVVLVPGDWWSAGEVEGDIPADTEISAILFH